jgi:hypothetical protein
MYYSKQQGLNKQSGKYKEETGEHFTIQVNPLSADNHVNG